MKTLRGLVILMTLSIALLGCDRDQQPAQSGNETPVRAETEQAQEPVAAEAAQEAQPGAVQCDRACLIGMVDSYLAALVAHDPAQVTIRLPVDGCSAALVIGEDREIAIDSGAIEDQFDPYGVHVYRCWTAG